MKKVFTNIWSITKETFRSFSEDGCMTHSASIAYYTVFSLPAILIIIVSIAGTIYGPQAVRGQLFFQIKGIVGAETASQIQSILENAALSDTGTILTIVGIVALLFSATTVFVSIQTALNNIWGVRPKPKKGFIKYIIDRLLSFAMVASIGFLMLVTLIIESLLVFLSSILTRIYLLSQYTVYVMFGINVVLNLIIITVVFGLIFKVLPDVRIKWRQVGIGAFATTLLFVLGKYLIGIYLKTSVLSSTYGAAGSLVVILVWVYYSTVILLLGAEFTKVYSKHIGIRVRPTIYSVKVEVKEMEL